MPGRRRTGSIVIAVFVMLAATSVVPVMAAETPSPIDPYDEIAFFDSSDGTYEYHDIGPGGDLGAPIHSGSDYTPGWDSITAIDLDGDGQDEIFFYNSTDGTHSYYDIATNGTLGDPLRAGAGYSLGWTSITAIDLDGDGRDEQFFYRSSDGAYRYYKVHPDGRLSTLLRGGIGYSLGWDSITAVDLDGDGRDEQFFYRSSDGAYRYYKMHADGRLSTRLASGTGYTTGWGSITAIDLDGGRDEMFFYRPADGAYRFYRMHADGRLSTLLQGGSGYAAGWDSITSIDLDWRFDEPVVLQPPLELMEVVSPFGPRRHPILGGVRLHAGIDLVAETGDPIYAAGDGVVLEAGVRGGYGNMVDIEHPGGLVTRYAHMSELGASAGDRVSAGQIIGYVGCTGLCTGPHLHFETRVWDVPVDPLGYLPEVTPPQ